MPRKVLIIQRIVPEYRKDFFNLLKIELAKDDIELTLIYGEKITPSKFEDDRTEMNWGKLVPNRTISFGKMKLCWQPLIGYLKDKDLVIVEQANKLILNYYIIIARHFWRNKLGFWGHGRNLQANTNSWGNKFSLLYLKKSDWWWGYTKGVKDFLITHNYPSTKITAVQNAINTIRLRNQIAEIDETEIRSLKDQLGIKGYMTAIFCGRMYAEKRIRFILESCHLIKKEISEFQMFFIGSGSESNKVEEASESYKWIHYLGPKNGKDRIKYFKLASIQLMPGTVGLGILDSFALETPIITTYNTTHSPEIEYLENGVNGIITKNTLEDYSRTIIAILKTNKYLELVNGCIRSANIYTIEKMVDNFKDGIVSCLHSK